MRIDCKAAGVWVTCHTDQGDFNVLDLRRVVIEGRRFTFEIVGSAPFSGRLSASTLHLGDLEIRKDIDPIADLAAGDMVHVNQPCEWVAEEP